MNISNIPFNALIVGPTNSGKLRFVVGQLYRPFRVKFDYIVLICPTFAHNKTDHRIGEKDPRMFFDNMRAARAGILAEAGELLFRGAPTRL